MPPIIYTPGIYLPNGEFIGNNGTGHAKNAREICKPYPELLDLMLNRSTDIYDDFIIMAGFAIVASYNSQYCFKVASDNPFPEILKLKGIYQKEIAKSQDEMLQIWEYWKIQKEYLAEVKKIAELVNVKDLYNKRGFLLLGRNWYPINNTKDGHDSTAHEIIIKENWTNEWRNSRLNPQDFLVCNKAAVQLGSGIFSKIVIASKKYYDIIDLKALASKHKLYDTPKEKYVFQLI